jgi:putative glutathione S-transferase
MLKELYLNADPQYEGRYTIPTLWDKQRQTIVNNESSEIIRMFYAEIDHPAQGDARSRPARRRTVPAPVRADIDAMNEWV